MKLILFKVLGGFKNHVFQRLEWVGKLAAAPPPNVARVPPPAAAPVTSKSWVLSVAARAAEPQQAPVAPGRLASASQSWALGVAACTMYKLPGVSEAQLIPPGGFQNKYDNLAPHCRKPTRRRGCHKRLPAATRHERDASLKRSSCRRTSEPLRPSFPPASAVAAARAATEQVSEGGARSL